MQECTLWENLAIIILIKGHSDEAVSASTLYLFWDASVTSLFHPLLSLVEMTEVIHNVCGVDARDGYLSRTIMLKLKMWNGLTVKKSWFIKYEKEFIVFEFRESTVSWKSCDF